MKIGSLFDGSGGFPLAATMCGIEPVWAAEIEPYPIAVTRSRFPNMKHLGSVTDIRGDEIEPVDVITFGSPCQDLSVAGKRAGLKHTENGDDETTRSGLFMEAIRIIKEMREATNGVYPRIAVWENVPGAFSSNKGEDFRIVLEEFIKVVEPTATMPSVPKSGWAYSDVYCGDGWSLAYRVLDAQYWGVPQRRRRIFLVADFRGRSAGKISFEREGLRGYFAESGAQREAAAGDAEGGVGTANREGIDVTAFSFDSLASNSMKSANPHSGCRQTEVSKCLDTTNPDPSKNQGGVAVVEAVGLDIYNLAVTGGQAATVSANSCMTATRNGPSVMIPYTLKIRSGCDIDANGRSGGKGALVQENMSATLAVAQDQYLFQPVTFEPGIAAREGGHIYDGVCGTLRANAGDNQMAIAYSIENHPADSRVNIDDSGKVQTLTSRMGTGGGNVPMVMEPVPFCKSARPRSADDATTWKEGKVANTLNTFDIGEVRTNELVVEAQEPVCYNGENITSPLNKTNPQSGDPCHTLGTDSRNYLVYCLQGAGATSQNSQGMGYKPDTSYTLNTTDMRGVVYAETYQKVTGPLMANSHPGSYTGQDAYNDMFVVGKGSAFGVDCRNATEYDEVNGTLQAKANGGFSYNCNQVVRVHYIVRRLTPTECARLQGFPDEWAHIDEKSDFTDEEYAFWLEVRNTHAAINDKAVKDYTKAQMLTWYNKLHTDSAEYKLWGNGVALPCVLYIMEGIAEALNEK